MRPVLFPRFLIASQIAFHAIWRLLGADIVKVKEEIQRRFAQAKKEIEDLGDWRGFKSGEWFVRLIHKTFRNYYEKAECGYLQEKYPGIDKDALAKKLTAIAAKQAAILGGIVGAAVSADEIVALVTMGEMGIGLPANITVALSALAAET